MKFKTVATLLFAAMPSAAQEAQEIHHTLQQGDQDSWELQDVIS
jgi:hypothetical protein